MKSCRTCKSTYPSQYAVCPQDGTPLIDVGAWSDGAVIRGKYRIMRKIGQGGMGAVYEAQHVRFQELRALKVISMELASDPSFVTRFINEAVITRKLQHPNAVRVEDVDEAEDGRPFIVMEYMEGQSLKALMRNSGPLPVPQVCETIREAAAALEAAHTLGMVHRDIKPDNIFIVEGLAGPQIKVLDFGIAKVKEATLGSPTGLSLTKTGIIVGTPQYMSPEQAMGMRGNELDGRSDLYSLGVVMYEMLTGDTPFQGDTTMKILMAHIHQAPPPMEKAHPELQIPLVVAQLVMRLLQKKPDMRPATAGELIKEIDAVLEALSAPLAATQVATPIEMAPPAKREWRAPEPQPPAHQEATPQPARVRPVEKPLQKSVQQPIQKVDALPPTPAPVEVIAKPYAQPKASRWNRFGKITLGAISGCGLSIAYWPFTAFVQNLMHDMNIFQSFMYELRAFLSIQPLMIGLIGALPGFLTGVFARKVRSRIGCIVFGAIVFPVALEIFIFLVERFGMYSIIGWMVWRMQGNSLLFLVPYAIAGGGVGYITQKYGKQKSVVQSN